MVSLVSLLSDSVLRGPRSAVLLGALYWTSALSMLSMTSALDLVIFSRVPWSLSVLLPRTRSLYTEVHGPWWSSLRRRRFPAFSDVRAFSFGRFSWSDSVISTEVRGLFGPLWSDSVLRVPRSEVPDRFSTTSALSRSLRRPRFGFGPFSRTDSANFDRSPWSFQSLIVRTRSLEVRGPRSLRSVLQIGWLRIFSI